MVMKVSSQRYHHQKSALLSFIGVTKVIICFQSDTKHFYGILKFLYWGSAICLCLVILRRHTKISKMLVVVSLSCLQIGYLSARGVWP